MTDKKKKTYEELKNFKGMPRDEFLGIVNTERNRLLKEQAKPKQVVFKISAHKPRFHFTPKLTKFFVVLALLSVISVATAVVYFNQTLNMSFKLKTTWQLAIEDVSNVAQTFIAFGEFDFNQKKNATNIDHIRNTATELIKVRYSVTLSDSSWSIKLYDSATSVWLQSDAKTIAYGSTMFLRIELTAPSSGQSTPQSGSVTFTIVDA